MSDYRIFLVGGHHDESGILTSTEDEDRCHLSFSYRDRAIEAESSDFFEAFCQIRLQLENEGLIPFCYGASLNVYPSGMARDMGAGLKAFRLTLGKHARMQDLVEVFVQGPDVIPTTVKLQQEFYEEWLNSPKS